MASQLDSRNQLHQLVPNPGVADQRLTVSTAPVSLAALDADTKVLLVSVEDQAIRYTIDGSTPTTTNGHVWAAGGESYFSYSFASAMQCIRDDGSDATLHVSELIYSQGNARRDAIRSVTFNNIFKSCVRRAHKNPDTAALTAGQEELVADHINTYLRKIWEFTRWPCLVQVDQRSVVETTDEVRYIPWTATGQYPIGSVLEVYKQHPYASDNPQRIRTIASPEGLVINPNYSLDEAWVRYRLRMPEFTRVAWSGLTTYAAGDIVYDSTTEECYEALIANTNQAVSDTSYWEQMYFPWIFKDYVRLAIVSEIAREEGKWERIVQSEDQAEKEMLRTYETEYTQQGEVTLADVRITE